jgi:hypothetical protein
VSRKVIEVLDWIREMFGKKENADMNEHRLVGFVPDGPNVWRVVFVD